MITREVVPPGWRWSNDIKPIVGTDLCRAFHQLFIVSGHLHVVLEDGAELDLRAGDAGFIPPGHDAWVVGNDSCDALDFSPDYVQLIDAGEAYQTMTAPAEAGARCSRAQAAKSLRSCDHSARTAGIHLVHNRPPHRVRRSSTLFAGSAATSSDSAGHAIQERR